MRGSGKGQGRGLGTSAHWRLVSHLFLRVGRLYLENEGFLTSVASSEREKLKRASLTPTNRWKEGLLLEMQVFDSLGCLNFGRPCFFFHFGSARRSEIVSGSAAYQYISVYRRQT